MSTTVSAPAKIILLGEHAVVYGVPAIALPVLNLRACATYRPSLQPLSITARDLGLRLTFGTPAHQQDASPLALLMQQTADRLDLKCPTGDITLSSDIPISSGLGSSAAVAAATARAIAALHQRKLPADVLNAIVYESERLQHGSPSGIDNTVVVYEKPILFRRDEPPQPLCARGEFTMLIANSGQPASTRLAVSHVSRLHQEDPAAIERVFAQIEVLVNEAKDCLQLGLPERLGDLMSRNHRLLQRLEVSSPRLDRLVDAALESGAHGAKLSGGGMGGNMVALVAESHNEATKRALLKNGAQAVRDFVLMDDRACP